ncbi:LamG domain-containing protein [Haloarcula amylovorans]|uniref:LamG domain-containing protein n=1 Tax=Haloarcula amylovorans TaxID=2562280 RepID=UPI0010765220|nr:LamG domain-containing protein [Halomicroarcula amylolytica]
MLPDPPPTDQRDSSGLSRRSLLKLTGTAFGTAAVAGCLGEAPSGERRVGYGGVTPAMLAAGRLSLSTPEDGLVARWTLDGTNSTAADAVGGNDGAIRGAPRQGVPGVHDSTAYDFRSGSGNYVEVADAGILRPTAELSVGGWYRTESGDTGQTLVQKADARFGETGYAVDVQTTNSIRGHVAVESGRATVNPFGVATHDGEWHHLFLTWDGSALVLYLDGEEIDRDTSQSGRVVHSNRSLFVGRGDNGYTAYYGMDGAIDDVRVYERALPASDVGALYEGESASPAPRATETATPTATTIANDEFGESGYGSHGYGGGVENTEP